jgi:hypothetical protein
MCLPKTWHARRVPERFVSTTSAHSSSGMVIVGMRLIFCGAVNKDVHFAEAVEGGSE